jgi:hypothetical protein
MLQRRTLDTESVLPLTTDRQRSDQAQVRSWRMVDRATLHVIIDKNGVVKIEISKHQITCK